MTRSWLYSKIFWKIQRLPTIVPERFLRVENKYGTKPVQISRISETTLVLGWAGWIFYNVYITDNILADLPWWTWKNGLPHDRKYSECWKLAPSHSSINFFLQALNAINLVWAFNFSSLKKMELFILGMDLYIHVNVSVAWIRFGTQALCLWCENTGWQAGWGD